MKTQIGLLSRSRTVAALAALGVMAALVTAGPAEATTPGDNGRIAFKGYLDSDRSTGAIFTIRPDGDRPRQVTFPESGTVDDQPDWSPNGALIAFRRCAPDAPCAIYTVRRGRDPPSSPECAVPCDSAWRRDPVCGRVGSGLPP